MGAQPSSPTHSDKNPSSMGVSPVQPLGTFHSRVSKIAKKYNPRIYKEALASVNYNPGWWSWSLTHDNPVYVKEWNKGKLTANKVLFTPFILSNITFPEKQLSDYKSKYPERFLVINKPSYDPLSDTHRLVYGRQNDEAEKTYGIELHHPNFCALLANFPIKEALVRHRDRHYRYLALNRERYLDWARKHKQIATPSGSVPTFDFDEYPVMKSQCPFAGSNLWIHEQSEKISYFDFKDTVIKEFGAKRWNEIMVIYNNQIGAANPHLKK